MTFQSYLRNNISKYLAEVIHNIFRLIGMEQHCSHNTQFFNYFFLCFMRFWSFFSVEYYLFESSLWAIIQTTKKIS